MIDETGRTIATLICEHALRRPNQPMVIDPVTRVSYGELDRTTRALAAGFAEAGIGPGMRVGLIMPNSARWVQIALALTRIGAVLVPFSTLLAPRELRAQLEVSAVSHLITTEEFRGHRYLDDLADALGRDTITSGELIDPGLPALRHIWTVDDVLAAGRSPDSERVVDALSDSVAPGDPMIIIFTSGSSGIPKGVIHSHGGALGAVAAGLAARCINSDTRLYLPMPFFWVGGFGAGILSALLAGATLVTEEIPRPETTLKLLERERVTLFRGWPDQAAALARQSGTVGADLSSLQVGSLDALLPPELRAERGARANLFGMTESFGPYCGYPADRDMPRAAWGSCGKPFDGMEVRIADPETGAPLPTGATGEIALRGPHVLLGICRSTREDVFTADGFYATGDLGHLDDGGFLFYHGRSDDMIKVSGATVYPSEVQAALKAIDGVDNAFVTHVDGEAGPRVAAAVVCRSSTTEDELRSAARNMLSSFKIPSVWLLLDSDDPIPRGGTGKVDARGLRELLTRAHTPTGDRQPAAAGAPTRIGDR
ncbi:class I adenylate-forming enzyme family protein [Gordonia sp. SL306]|uniref:class I adenylate-forming enzyme family protein n=1 Tax=Gordonia sp. SL306 TaxID=2995145 RepID=UPI00226E0CFD|nr:class I adenylate-forming enzyme family protein [Gordonia sp. SL306]WAC58037.1 class I adenylate-forming enzyme family protein [Gordonia sp. SL306]